MSGNIPPELIRQIKAYMTERDYGRTRTTGVARQRAGQFTDANVIAFINRISQHNYSERTRLRDISLPPRVIAQLRFQIGQGGVVKRGRSASTAKPPTEPKRSRTSQLGPSAGDLQYCRVAKG